MSKYILGIIAIACLQIAYTAYSRIDLAFETAQLSPGPPALDHEAGPIELPETNEFAINNTDAKIIRRAPVRQININYAVAKPRKADRFVPRFAARRESVKPRQRTEYPTINASDRAALPRTDDMRDKKRRSIFTKASTVIKKPYDWARSLVAMLR